MLLLDAAQAYHREVGRQSGTVSPAVSLLLERLTDPSFTHLFIVTHFVYDSKKSGRARSVGGAIRRPQARPTLRTRGEGSCQRR